MTAGKHTPKFESNLPIPQSHKMKRTLTWASAAAPNAGGISAGAPYHTTQRKVLLTKKLFFAL